MGNSSSSTSSSRPSIVEDTSQKFYSVRLKPFTKTSPLKYEIVCKASHGDLLSTVISKVNAFRRPGKEILKILQANGTEISMNETMIVQDMIFYV
jgi:hypothetical protein